MRKICVILLLAIASIGACVAADPSLEGWVCNSGLKAQDCGTAEDYICYQNRCRKACTSKADCPTGSDCALGLVCLPRDGQSKEPSPDAGSAEQPATEVPVETKAPDSSSGKSETQTGTEEKPPGEPTPREPPPCQPVREICDGKDNNCDGQIDESFPEDGQFCIVKSSMGLCKEGISSCVKGQLVCTSSIAPSAEKCDEKDNNCDGVIDENCPCFENQKRTCFSGRDSFEGKGVCRRGTRTCGKDRKWGPCEGQVLPSPETCDGKDNDCDGLVDETCLCKPGEKKKCGKDVGECEFGEQTCQSTQVWGPCEGGIGPSPEVCDRKDTDCDGKADVCGRGSVMCTGKRTFRRCAGNCQGWSSGSCKIDDECIRGQCK